MPISQLDKQPSFGLAVVTLLSIFAVIAVGLFYLHTSLHALILIAIIIAALSTFSLGYRFRDIRDAMNQGISSAFSAIYIFILIGVMIAALIQSGTIATLIYYGIQFMSPAIFLPTGLILCSIMSLATGTSWGTVGTVGVVLIGIGVTLGIPAPLVAGMVVSGACFGDKVSPVSDTTNLAAMASKVKLYDHIQGMLYTTGPAFILALLTFAVLGMQYAENSLPTQELLAIQSALDGEFELGVVTLLPFVLMLGLSVFRVSAEPSMVAASVAAVVLALGYQDQSLSAALSSLYSGGEYDVGIASLNDLLSRGGIESMLWTLSLSLMALSLGGILEHFKFLSVLISSLVKRIKRAWALVATTIVASFTGNVTMGEAYMSIILGGQLFGEAYDQKNVDRRVLSRSLEEGGTLTAGLIPWTTAGAFFTSTLGVSALEYAPWALLNWLSPLIAITIAMTSIGMFRNNKLETN